MSSVGVIHPSSIWPADMHTIPITKEQAELLIEYVEQETKKQTSNSHMYIKHDETNTIHRLRLVYPGVNYQPGNHYHYLTDRYAAPLYTGTWDCFAGWIVPCNHKDDMIGHLVKEYSSSFILYRDSKTKAIAVYTDDSRFTFSF